MAYVINTNMTQNVAIRVKGPPRILLKRYFCNNLENCGYSEECNIPHLPPLQSKLKTCTGCQLVKYCSEDCERLKWPEHKELCKKRRNDLRKLDELQANAEKFATEISCTESKSAFETKRLAFEKFRTNSLDNFKDNSCGNYSVVDTKVTPIGPFVCKGCKLTTYCTRRCRDQTWPNHKRLCREIQKDLDELKVLDYEYENAKAYDEAQLDYLRLVKTLEKETHELAEKHLDYFMFSAAASFCGLWIEGDKVNEHYPKREKYEKMLYYVLTLDMTSCCLEYKENKSKPNQTEATYGIGTSIATLVVNMKNLGIPETCQYMESYEVFAQILRSAPRDSVFYRLYCNHIPMKRIKNCLTKASKEAFDQFKKPHLAKKSNPINLPKCIKDNKQETFLKMIIELEPMHFDPNGSNDGLESARLFDQYFQKHPQLRRFLKENYQKWQKSRRPRR